MYTNQNHLILLQPQREINLHKIKCAGGTPHARAFKLRKNIENNDFTFFLRKFALSKWFLPHAGPFKMRKNKNKFFTFF